MAAFPATALATPQATIMGFETSPSTPSPCRSAGDSSQGRSSLATQTTRCSLLSVLLSQQSSGLAGSQEDDDGDCGSDYDAEGSDYGDEDCAGLASGELGCMLGPLQRGPSSPVPIPSTL